MKYYAQIEDKEYGLDVHHTAEGIRVRPIEPDAEAEIAVDFATVHSNLDTGEGLYSIIANGKSYQLYVEPQDTGFRIVVWRHRFNLQVLTEREWRLQKVAPRQAGHSGDVTLNAPMPGLVKDVLVSPGDAVTRGQRVLVLEAMKMENDISAPRDGIVKTVYVQPGTVIEAGKPLISIES
jgi:glutaconyl-CoA/methylmalonyl-CoA decarboxylase subunit gamma